MAAAAAAVAAGFARPRSAFGVAPKSSAATLGTEIAADAGGVDVGIVGRDLAPGLHRRLQKEVKERRQGRLLGDSE